MGSFPRKNDACFGEIGAVKFPSSLNAPNANRDIFKYEEQQVVNSSSFIGLEYNFD